MSNDPPALSGIDAGLPQEAEYDTVYAAVTATERGRWFLTEFASRNRHADTDSLIAAIARIEAAIRSDTSAKESIRGPDVGAAADRLADIAFGLRERGADAALCDALDAAVREMSNASATAALNHDAKTGATLPGQGTARTAVQTAPEPARELVEGASADPLPYSELFVMPSPDSEKFAAFATSLSALADDAEIVREPQSMNSTAVIPQHDYEAVSAPTPAETADRAPRWQIDAPDFVFHLPKHGANGHAVESFGGPSRSHALLPGAQLPPSPDEDPAELFDSTPQRGAVFPHSAPLLSAPMPVPTPSAPAVLPSVAVAPKADMPPARSSTVAPVRPVPRPAPVNPLAALRALTEEELIALFG